MIDIVILCNRQCIVPFIVLSFIPFSKSWPLYLREQIIHISPSNHYFRSNVYVVFLKRMGNLSGIPLGAIQIIFFPFLGTTQYGFLSLGIWIMMLCSHILVYRQFSSRAFVFVIVHPDDDYTLTPYLMLDLISTFLYCSIHTSIQSCLRKTWREKGLSWSSWSDGSWIYNYLCNQCISPLT